MDSSSNTQIRPWLLGNTTVRSPLRLRELLIALSCEPSLLGNLRGIIQEKKLCLFLGKSNIVKLGNDKTFSVFRKWRSALNKLGFLYPKIPFKTQGLIKFGDIDTITPNGRRLIQADTIPAMQECFLRALVGCFIPSPIENNFNFTPFSPLQHVLTIMLDLEKQTGSNHITFIEMALIIQISNSNDSIDRIIEKIISLRERKRYATNKKKFDKQEKEKITKLTKTTAQTLYDYADTNLRYLKATGLVHSKGRGISFVPEKHLLIEKITQNKNTPDTDNFLYFENLCNGAILPIDNKAIAQNILNNQLITLKALGIKYNISDMSLDTSENIALVSHHVDALIFEKKEKEFSENQVKQYKEILTYMELLIENKKAICLHNNSDLQKITIPKSEAPAYFEWIIWRSFLAIGNFINKPSEARRFKIDQDFLPINFAPPNGADLIFEYNDFILAIEVTLTNNSRQEAAEGEPVRRHIADLMQKQEKMNKPVYGLFIANNVDSNTAETFRKRVWFNSDNNKMYLNIIPMTLNDFKNLFETMFNKNHVNIEYFRNLIIACIDFNSQFEGPGWKKYIQQTIKKFMSDLISNNKKNL